MAQWTTLPSKDKNIEKTGASTAVYGDTHPSLPTTSFAAQVRTGYLGNRKTIKVYPP
jgi:hypothetical protein